MTLQSLDHLRKLDGKRIIVLGDVMLDTFVYGHCARISPEAPIPVVRIEREEVMLGGAGNVARNIAALGAEAILIGVVGQDAAGAALRTKIHEEARIYADLALEQRPTTQKIRYIAAQQQMLRVDIEESGPIGAASLLHAFARQLPTADAVVLSDYAKGVLTPDLLTTVIRQARAAGKPIIADPKTIDVARYDGVTLLTPNAAEAAQASGQACDEDEGACSAADQLLAAMPTSPAVLITRGAKGMTLAQRGAPAIHLPALARAVFDVSGAGDTVVAMLAVALASGLDVTEAAHLANVAAGKAVSKPGTAVVTVDELREELQHDYALSTSDKIAVPSGAVRIIDSWRRCGARIGFTNGCFDLLHPGHLSQLAQARAVCDRLVVGLNTDASIQRLKGPARPVQHEQARAAVLAALTMVDLVILFGDDTPIDLITLLRPDILIKGKDYTVDRIAGADFVQSYGGRIFLADLLPGHSTTKLINRINHLAN
ncbi:D-glycero-beta-D-manno-heptose-7-phosphate kinase [Sphingomonas sp. CV7422]|uniref:D-glycero-beta-D-manno-heptose-7-phosphate kinase n=1 Tax=Sphingomonas sp. CV7422 TaxID=3018036 RepID=UPI0022FEFA53|nr:D-glycero-beta-D-manno-heptose-7-phosphate kinase [Sphingomonas sp. CV7422]